MLGLTVIEAPVPCSVPPQLEVYHRQTAPVPRLPAVTFSVVVCPAHIVPSTAAAVGSVDSVLTVTVVF